MHNDFNPFKLQLKSKLLASTIESVLGLKTLIRHYDARPKKDGVSISGYPFLEHTLKCFGVDIQVLNEHHLKEIPKTGPVIFFANHPFGGLEGVGMTKMLLECRPDTKVLTNEMLTRIPELSDLFIGVDVLSKNAARANAKGIRAVCKHLANDGAVLIYPAGMVSAINKSNWKIEDREWNSLVGKLAIKYQATCIPFFVEGRNSKLFYTAGLIHKRLRTMLLPRELGNKNGTSLVLRAGHAINPKEFKELENDTAVTHYLRLTCDLLSKEEFSDEPNELKYEPIERPDNRIQNLNDLKKLDDCILTKSGDFTVYCASYERLGSLMNEIAYAREETFRAVGEGTGKELDRDHFDPYYLHLFLWDNKKQRLAGGYRLGRADEIIAKHGVKALYSRSLYHYDKSYLTKLGKSLELGRSFIQPEYQKLPLTLDLLWRGIGHYVAQNPEYPTLFGCVSISKEHTLTARAFLSDSLMEGFRAEQKYLADVRPLEPLKIKGKIWKTEALAALSKVSIINKLLGRCDPGKSIPILLRQYIAMNGRFVGFTVNKGFNDSLDGLIICDLRKSPQRYLRRYLGKEGAANFLEKWDIEINSSNKAA
ncbi:MAG: hemolysin [Hyphomicrobiales bacterium]|nr:lysophospholipid acyltransferase family protein [Hyphomicrobiales bacterium]PCH50614.1 MAG: hemolysin [Hyphomicrobiales bacterium]